jgi:predicted alpha/beta hydrolase
VQTCAAFFQEQGMFKVDKAAQHSVITTADGFALSASRYVPAGAPRAVIVLPGAMGVKQEFYAPFATFLAEQGYAVLSFDYRGMGASRPAAFRTSLRGFDTDLTRWAEQDYNAVLHAAKAWQPEVPLYVIGHSLGGQLPGLVPDFHMVDALVTVASGSGYWLQNAPQLKRTVWFLWYFVEPLMTPLFGYFPGKRLGMVGDLPKGVIRQWSRWCRNPHYVSDEQGAPIRAGYDTLRMPLLSLSFADDEMMSRQSIASMHDCYRHAPQERRHIGAQDTGERHIGHFGFFRPQFRATLWQQTLDWLQQSRPGKNQDIAA